MPTFAEVFNGTGYADNGYISAYLYNGTNIYSKGKYASDGRYDPNLVDAQSGVYILLKAIMS
jgi:lysozyme family protein